MSFHTALSSGTILLGTGIYAYVTTKSVPSLAGSLGLSSAFYAATYLIRKTEYQTTGHALAAVGGAVALALGVKRLKSSPVKPGIRVGPYSLLLVGVMNVPYQFMKSYEWSQSK
jgi:uncharacterized membrane protein (UPF0136 family)